MRKPFFAAGLMTIALPVATTLCAQLLHSDSPLPTFEVATVRLLSPGAPLPPVPFSIDPPKSPLPPRIAPGRGGAQTTDHIHATEPLRLFLAFAYNVPFGFENRYVLGGPAWLDLDVYEITAKIDDSTFAAMQKLPADQQRDQVHLMEQALLADRFHLKAHFETRMMPALALTLAKGTPKLAPAQPGETTRLAMQGDTITANAITLDQLIHSPFLASQTILNQTGLTAAYDFTLTYSNRTDAAADDPSAAPALTTAFEQQLGLRLTPTKAPVEVLVIDHIERPSEN